MTHVLKNNHALFKLIPKEKKIKRIVVRKLAKKDGAGK